MMLMTAVHAVLSTMFPLHNTLLQATTTLLRLQATTTLPRLQAVTTLPRLQRAGRAMRCLMMAGCRWHVTCDVLRVTFNV